MPCDTCHCSSSATLPDALFRSWMYAFDVKGTSLQTSRLTRRIAPANLHVASCNSIDLKADWLQLFLGFTSDRERCGSAAILADKAYASQLPSAVSRWLLTNLQQCALFSSIRSIHCWNWLILKVLNSSHYLHRWPSPSHCQWSLPPICQNLLCHCCTIA